MLDFDLAKLYGVTTKALNQAMKRNLERFPSDFSFQLTKEQWDALRSQIVTAKKKGNQYLPFAYTEHGVTMLASVLRSERAVKMNIAIVRAFIALRKISMHYNELAEKIKELEIRYNKQFFSPSKTPNGHWRKPFAGWQTTISTGKFYFVTRQRLIAEEKKFIAARRSIFAN
ncbi:phage regulator Rha-like protein [Chitinophagaceae bacterium OAS944]|nr:phage regulator Rha-like protein [Chitinophagaceae bacterium OAS944]